MPRRSRSYSSRSRSRSDGKWSRSPRSKRADIAPNTQIYVARFGRRTHETDLRKAFERYGRIVSIDIKYHGCFAFIVYEDSRHAQEAVEGMNGRSLPHESDRLIVEPAGANKTRRRRGSHERDSPRGGSNRCFNCNKEGHW